MSTSDYIFVHRGHKQIHIYMKKIIIGYQTKVGQLIKAKRLYKNITLPRLALKAKISKGGLSKIENHSCNVTLETLLRIAKALDCTVKDLLP